MPTHHGFTFAQKRHKWFFSWSYRHWIVAWDRIAPVDIVHQTSLAEFGTSRCQTASKSDLVASKDSITRRPSLQEIRRNSNAWDVPVRHGISRDKMEMDEGNWHKQSQTYLDISLFLTLPFYNPTCWLFQPTQVIVSAACFHTPLDCQWLIRNLAAPGSTIPICLSTQHKHCRGCFCISCRLQDLPQLQLFVQTFEISRERRDLGREFSRKGSRGHSCDMSSHIVVAPSGTGVLCFDHLW